MEAYAKLRAAVNNYESHTGKPPETLILDSFFHERLKMESKEGPEDTIGELKSIFGIPVVLLRNSLVVS